MLSANPVRWCAVLAAVGSFTFASAAEPASSTTQGEAKSEPPKQEPAATESDAEDLEHTLEHGGVEPVSRVMGTRIVASAVKPYIHGAFAVDWRWGDGSNQIANSFDLREAHLYVGAHILDFIQPEVFFELEKKNQTDDPVKLRYGQVDFRLLQDLVVLRAGLFLVPFGIYNTEIFLRTDVKFPERPDTHRRLVPGSWSEVGVQVRGRWEWGPGRFLQYAAYVTNGQEGALTVSRAGYNPVWRSLTGAKSLGARVSVQPLEGLIVGLSGYRGALNGVEGALALGAVDVIFRYGPFSVDGEGLFGRRLDPGPIPEGGFHVAAGYKIIDQVELVLGGGWLTTGPSEEEHGLEDMVGINVRPAPDRFPTAVLKAAWEHDYGAPPEGGNQVTIMFAVGF